MSYSLLSARLSIEPDTDQSMIVFVGGGRINHYDNSSLSVVLRDEYLMNFFSGQIFLPGVLTETLTVTKPESGSSESSSPRSPTMSPLLGFLPLV